MALLGPAFLLRFVEVVCASDPIRRFRVRFVGAAFYA